MEERWNALQRGERLAVRMRLDPCAVSDVILAVFEQCSASHDASRGSFVTYYTTCLKRELARTSAELTRQRMDVGYEHEVRQREKAFGHSPLEHLITLEGKDEPGIADALKQLNEEELELLADVYQRGMTMWELGVKHGIVKQSAWARLQKILRKLRDEVR